MSDWFQNARVKLVVQHPFFGELALYLKEVEVPENSVLLGAVPTVGVDNSHLYVNPKFVKSLSPDEMLGLLAHEVLHVALGHIFPWRRKHRDHKKWNMAGDYIINQIVLDSGLKLPKGGLFEQQFKDKSTEEVYSILSDAQQQSKNGMKKQGGTGSKAGKGSKGAKEGNGDTNLPWEDLVDSEELSEKSEGEQQQLENEWKSRLVQAAISAKTRGKLPAGIERLVDDILNPVLPWTDFLSNFVNEVLHDDYDLLQSDRRFISEGLYLPDLYNEGCSVAIAVDTSGSIGPEELALFTSECFGILTARAVKKIRIMSFDTKVHMDKVIQPWDDLPKKFPGGGGSDTRCVFKRLSHDCGMERPACLIVLTDMYVSFPQTAPAFPVLWVTKTDPSQISPPFGTVIQFDPEEGLKELAKAEGTDFQDDNDGYDPYDDDSEIEDLDNDED